ncbi:MAG: hypothetical protein M0D57_03230 [Sphingobacteriales bacterium JAD_PAG50586_3]|nr:MAG: hypothetical protein M0D57_03230 [Sphingobacteriales bacterium JAD_PAG50586_3]
MKYYLMCVVTAIALLLLVIACKKEDTTCGIQVAVTDTLNNKLKHKWVVFDVPDNLPPAKPVTLLLTSCLLHSTQAMWAL